MNVELRPKKINPMRAVWLKLRELGYDVIPLKEGKATPFKGWRVMQNDPDDIARWGGHSAGIRLEDSGAIVFDFDVRIQAVLDALLEMMRQEFPEFWAGCLVRHSGAVKVALIGRCPDTHYASMATHRYAPDPAAPDVKEHECRVEVFTTLSKRYVAVYGAHSEGREYGYDGPTILERPLAELPAFPADRIGRLLERCEQIMAAAGLVAHGGAVGGSTLARVYDLTPDMVFKLKDGEQVTLKQLADIAREQGRQEGYATIWDKGSDCPDRVKVNWSGEGLALWDSHTEISHRFADAQAGVPDLEALRAALGPLGEYVRPAGGKAEEGSKPRAEQLEWADTYKSGLPRPTLSNTLIAIVRAGVHCSEDTFHNHIWLGRSDASAPGEVAPPWAGPMTDSALRALRVALIGCCSGTDFGEKNVIDAVMVLAREQRYDPIVNMLAEAQGRWDGQQRLGDAEFIEELFGCEGDDHNLEVMCLRKTLIAAVRRARSPGCKFDTIPVLEGKEGVGKSSAWAILAGEGNFSDERIIGANSREVQEHLAGVWIHENADLAGMRKAEVEVVKTFASRVEDRARPAYGRLLVSQPRRSIEVGTTNNERYLQSQTGNRRFWPIKIVRRIDLSLLRKHRLQLWGEAAHYEAAGEELTLPEELWADAEMAQEDRRVEHPWEELLENLQVIGAGPDPLNLAVVKRTHTTDYVSSADIFSKVLGVQRGEWQRHGRALADAMRVLGWTPLRYRLDGAPQARGYMRRLTPLNSRAAERRGPETTGETGEP